MHNIHEIHCSILLHQQTQIFNISNLIKLISFKIWKQIIYISYLQDDAMSMNQTDTENIGGDCVATYIQSKLYRPIIHTSADNGTVSRERLASGTM